MYKKLYGPNGALGIHIKKLTRSEIFGRPIYQAKGYENEEAATLAVEQCINGGVLLGFLRKHRAEVSEMLLTEFDEKAFREGIHEEGFEEGINKINARSFCSEHLY